MEMRKVNVMKKLINSVVQKNGVSKALFTIITLTIILQQEK
jgi:hypothetical protein